jgi:hypothetical protein
MFGMETTILLEFSDDGVIALSESDHNRSDQEMVHPTIRSLAIMVKNRRVGTVYAINC